MSALHEGHDAHVCTGKLDRRAFMRQATGFAGAVLAVLGAGPAMAGAMVGEAHALESTTSAGGVPVRQYDAPLADGALVDADNELLLVRWNGRVYAFSMSCPHRGEIIRWEGNGAFCPKHKARFSPDGANIGGRRSRALDRYPIRREGARVVVELTGPLEQDADAAAWGAAWVAAG